MRGSTIRQTAEVRKGGPFRILAVIAVVTLAPACELVIEYDYLGEPAPKTSATYTGGSQRSIGGLYEATGFDDVLVHVKPVAADAAYQEWCIKEAYLDANFSAIEDYRPNWPESAWCWYAHGLMVDAVCNDLEGTGGTSGYEGALWFPPSECNGTTCEQRRRTREKFIVVRAKVEDDPKLNVRVAVHELAHVFNLHHCDLDADGVETYPPDFEREPKRSLEHMIEHKDSHESYVKPGPKQEPFCGVSLQMPPDHMEIHSVEEEKGVAECAVSACATLASLLKAEQPAALRLAIEPEKPSFAPGEPILLRAVLETEGVAATGTTYSGEQSLDPQLNRLRIWAGTTQDDLWPVDPLLMFDAELARTEFPGRVEAAGLDAWFLLPFDLKTVQDTLYVRATFTDASRVARTGTVEVAINRQPPSGPPDPDVLQWFTHPESRRYLYFLGGDHLEQGRQMLEQVASQATGTIYGTYADLALGVGLGQPFRLYDRKQGKQFTRPADPDAAQVHLDRADPHRQQLPPTKRRSLAQVRGLVYEALGDRAAQANPGAAVAHYREALEMFYRLNTLPRPLMMTRAEYNAKITEQIERVRSKLAQFPAPV